MTISELMREYGIRGAVTWGYNGHTPDYIREWAVNTFTAKFWRTIKGKRRRFTVPFYGGADVVSVTPEQVLDTIIEDCQMATVGFDEWTWDMGFDADSRLARRVYNRVLAQSRRLSRFLGAEYREFLAAGL